MLLSIEDLESLSIQAFMQVQEKYHEVITISDLQSIAIFQIAFMDLAKELIEEKKRVIAKGIINDPEFQKPKEKTNKIDNIFVILAFLFATLFASCGNDNATATPSDTSTTKIDTQAICGNYCNPYIKQILVLKQERDSLDALLNAFVEQAMRLELKGTTEFYSPTKTKTTTSNKKQPSTGVPKQKYTYVGQVYRGKKGGLFQVYIDDTGKRQKHYISSQTQKTQILDSKNYIDVSRETLDDFILSKRIPVK